MDSPPSEVSPGNGSGRGRSKGRHKRRVRVWTEDDRAKHRVFEKGRREAFSDSLLVRGKTIIAIAYTDVLSRLLRASCRT
jgi:urease accessory protein UreE